MSNLDGNQYVQLGVVHTSNSTQHLIILLEIYISNIFALQNTETLPLFAASARRTNKTGPYSLYAVFTDVQCKGRYCSHSFYSATIKECEWIRNAICFSEPGIY